MACSSESVLLRANSWGSQGMGSLGLWNVGGVLFYTGVWLWSDMREGGEWLVEMLRANWGGLRAINGGTPMARCADAAGL